MRYSTARGKNRDDPLDQRIGFYQCTIEIDADRTFFSRQFPGYVIWDCCFGGAIWHQIGSDLRR